MRVRERVLAVAAGAAALLALATPSASGATVSVSTSAELKSALAAATPGTTIQLAADTTFTGNFKAAVNGTAADRITLTGPRSAVLTASGGRGLELTGSYWTISGFTITGAQLGLMALGVHDTLVDGLKVTGVDNEGIHFQYTSSDNVVQNSEISDTGKDNGGFGEGIYFGSANSNWPDGQPDHSDRNKALNNKIGPDVRAESIDVKEGTTGGELRGNTFDGTGQSGETVPFVTNPTTATAETGPYKQIGCSPYPPASGRISNCADSWVDVKGNGYLVTGNKGSKVFMHDATYGAFEVHVQVDGWGQDNTFSDNTADVQAPSAYGFYVVAAAQGNKVCASNTVTGAGKGFANVAAAQGC
ncbi:right-handed parallel beta-helix repeat-containing protein [Amycolatopsis sp. NBC_00345]|uniref:right-handed parallel beta-helix repeat-containing protein n=1 Tax=Amycolatopsis sp. NBC_00345 TaxID=2975955 RepID=UPI002E25B692